MQYYYRDSFEAQLCDDFAAIVQDHPQIRFFQPSPEKAPWHVQAIIDDGSDDPIELNFWPHKAKAQRKPLKSVEGLANIRALIREALADADAFRPFDVIEAGD